MVQNNRTVRMRQHGGVRRIRRFRFGVNNFKQPFGRSQRALQFGGILFMSLFLTYEFSDIKRITISFLIGVEYAVIDEIHQLFVDGRSGQITDVFIDSIGIALGICFTMIVYKIVLKIVEKRKEGASG